MNKIGVVLQVTIVIMLAVIIALVVYYGTNSPKPVRSHMPPIGGLVRSSRDAGQAFYAVWFEA